MSAVVDFFTELWDGRKTKEANVATKKSGSGLVSMKEIGEAIGREESVLAQRQLSDMVSLMGPSALINPSRPSGWADYSEPTFVYWERTAGMASGGASTVPKKVELKRKALDTAAVDPFTESEQGVFARAKAELGYKRPIKPEEKPLYKALARLGIAPFADADVRAYMSSKVTRGFLQSTVWARAPLAEFTGMVPEFAIQRALDIKTECPGATFMVDSLVTRPDPFLIAVLGDEQFVVDVWDEPDFHAKRVY